MAKFIWALICKETALTPQGDIAINGEFAIVSITTLPGKSPPFYIIGRFTGKPKEIFRFKLRIIEPEGKDIINDNWTSYDVGEDGFGFLTLQMNTVEFPLFGKYRVELITDESKYTLPLILKQSGK